MVKKLLEGGAIGYLPDRHGNNAIHLAVKHVTLSCLRVLLEDSKVKLDLDAKNFEGESQMYAVQIISPLKHISTDILNAL